MQSVLKRAWTDTLSGLGLERRDFSLRRLLSRAVVVPAIFVVLIWWWRGTAQAVIEGFDIFLYGLAFCLAAVGTFVAVFLWNLWLAPHRIIHDQLDKIAAAQPSNSVVNEAAQERTLNYHKTRTALAEMKGLSRCIDARVSRGFEPLHLRSGVKGFDHQFETLTEKYSDWLPSDIAERDMGPWVGRTITTLKAFEYPDAKERIEQAASAGAWKTKAE